MPITNLDTDLTRILRARDADLGLFVLAMHSLMERCLKQKYAINNYDSDNDFGVLINRYTSDFYTDHGKPIYKGAEKRTLSNEDWALFKILKKIYKNHYLANDVRHKFAEISPEDAQTTVECFLAFSRAEKWGELRALTELQKELQNWDSHSPYQSEELTKAIAQIEKLKKENENLAQKANDYSELQDKLRTVEAHENYLIIELAESEKSLSRKNEKLDELRKKNNEQFMKLKKEKDEILLQLKDYASTKEYLSYLEKVAAYTRTRHDYESSVIRLTPEQNEVLEQIFMNSDNLVKGAAGTGKSFVLLKTLEKAINELKSEFNFEDATSPLTSKFKLLTYTKSLVKYNQYVTRLLGTEVPENSITTADSFLHSMLKKFFPSKELAFGFEPSFETIFASESFSAKDMYVECQEFIWANCITKDDYIVKVCDRSGMRNPLKKAEREEMWNTLEKAEKTLENSNVWPRNFAAKKIINAMETACAADFCTEFSFVDEAQDLPPVILALIKKSTKRGVFLAGDSDQSIYRKGFNWNLSGIDIRGRTKILKTNFRNTSQIHAYAESYRAKFKNMDKSTQPLAFRPGPPVEHTCGKNTDELISEILQQVKMLLGTLNYEEENICIIANQTKKLEKIQNRLDAELSIKAVQIGERNFDFADTKGIRLCTMQNCKGLDFPVVLLLADHRVQGMEEGSAFDSETFYEQQYNMVYVCLTRAMEMLHIYTVKDSGFAPFRDLS
ncbi:UvrD-helicase domain-containing protein [Treponema bryantii]|uniref:UvrD-helicase domain-containing protein n=1 Tax=Treponema bryantii TaxID=163 RepID=UPI0003B41CBA|nr:UvrD-helicase domain-containing protein [Treponema bryantii]